MAHLLKSSKIKKYIFLIPIIEKKILVGIAIIYY